MSQLKTNAAARGRRADKHRGGLLLLLAVVFFTTAFSARAQQTASASEYQVKAAFLYNFAKFVEWPAESFAQPAAPIQLCVLGRDDFGQELEAITHGKSVEGHPIQINHVVALNWVRNCHILFVTSSERRRTREIFSSLQNTSVLTVGDEPGFATSGGVINFVMENDRVRFEVNLEAANQAHLRISSKLLVLAKLVRTNVTGGR